LHRKAGRLYRSGRRITMVDALRLRKHLDQTVIVPPLPEGVVRLPLWQAKPVALHALLERAYSSGGGSVPGFTDWFFPLVEDEEFDPALLIVLAFGDAPVGLVQCWTSGFIKDIVVAPEARNKGLGAWLLYAALAELHQRGL